MAKTYTQEQRDADIEAAIEAYDASMKKRKWEEIERIDRVNELAMKLDSLLMVTHGEAGESFRNFHNGIQDRFLWACSGVARELVEALGLADLPGVGYD